MQQGDTVRSGVPITKSWPQREMIGTVLRVERPTPTQGQHPRVDVYVRWHIPSEPQR